MLLTGRQSLDEALQKVDPLCYLPLHIRFSILSILVYPTSYRCLTRLRVTVTVGLFGKKRKGLLLSSVWPKSIECRYAVQFMAKREKIIQEEGQYPSGQAKTWNFAGVEVVENRLAKHLPRSGSFNCQMVIWFMILSSSQAALNPGYYTLSYPTSLASTSLI